MTRCEPGGTAWRPISCRHAVPPVLIGRDREVELLDTHLAAAGKGRGGAVFIVGDPGIGKSRLTAECLHRAREAGMTTLRGRGSGVSADVPFKPLSEALFSFARSRRPPSDPALAPYLPALTTLIPEWRQDGAAAHLESKTILAEAVLRLLMVIGRGTGCLLVLEDLHEADADTLALVDYLADNLAEVPAVLLVNLRGHAGPALTLAYACARRQVTEIIELAPLSPSQTRLLAEACLDPPGDLPPQLIPHVERETDGVPFLVEEFIGTLVGMGALWHDGEQWRLSADSATRVPTTLARSIGMRLATLGPSTHDPLRTAAVFGVRFPVSVIQESVGMGDHEMAAFLRSATVARLIAPDDECAGEWYAFRHSLTAEALLAPLIPAERASFAKRAADALERLHPDLPGEWCQIAANLRLAAGDTPAAAGLLAEAGSRYLNSGAANLAATMLERAYALRETAPADLRARTLQQLLHALTEGGGVDRALALAKDISLADDLTMTIGHEIDLRTKLAWVAAETGGIDDGRAHVAVVRRLLDACPDEARTAAIDVIEAELLVPDHGVLQQSAQEMTAPESLVTRAAQVAERIPLPEVACQAWERMAMLSRVWGFDESDRCLTRMQSIAEAHDLTLWKLRAMLRLAGNHGMRTGENEPLEEVRRSAAQAGAISLVHSAEATLAMTRVLRGEYAAADEIATSCIETTIRLGHIAYTQYLLLAQATLAAHQARRADMERTLAEFRRWGGEQSLHMPVVYGLCLAMCALLEEDRDGCRELLTRAREWEDEHPTIYYMTGRYGLGVLLDALAAQVGLAEWEIAEKEPAAELRWNRHFLYLAKAVLLGRQGDSEGATGAMEMARAAAEPYPLAEHLGLRLVAESALADQWGEPLVWLRTAEEYFHEAGIAAVTAACRALLRKAGATVTYRRAGHDELPAPLRNRGVTVREHQVLVLLAERCGNVEIGKRLFISPRTVEKHVASLLSKTGLPDRAALREYAATLPR
ncbi:helix-turn-helix transcriptional regulator [Sphaerimonospora sp. CA-214678]|uniref:helix-turn-helix transcriptional regulator n=1 Tax=Sphaerimonospora sp. CA-214678 TaxID=3240029 RepID=UPI003D8C3CB7